MLYIFRLLALVYKIQTKYIVKQDTVQCRCSVADSENINADIISKSAVPGRRARWLGRVHCQDMMIV